MTKYFSSAWKIVALVVLSVTLVSCSGKGVVESLFKGNESSYVRIWFVKPTDQGLVLIPVMRPKMSDESLKGAVIELLRGPSKAERMEGLASEIPVGTILLAVKNNQGNVELNLSRRFASGGGCRSMETRLEQLSRTVAGSAGQDKVFLSIEGERLSTYAGEGLEIKQPIK
ncbi:MAG: GerMN domain-containing protein [Candidatus Melainabacteria bacterium]|nr:GerMN domain-containing protein [Candidatus Melainabacteria bacterium]